MDFKSKNVKMSDFIYLFETKIFLYSATHDLPVVTSPVLGFQCLSHVWLEVRLLEVILSFL